MRSSAASQVLPRSRWTPPSPRRAPGSDARADLSLWVRLLESHNLMLAEVRKRLADRSTLPRFDLLANLAREDGQTLAALSRRMLVTAGNLTGLVDRAARDGLVIKRSDASDRRVSRVYLTRKGRTLVQEMIPRHARAVQRTLSPLGAQEQGELRRLLGKLRTGLATAAPGRA
jgi:DNA-binding MarR family transcriptional regulator